jgi:hypothetical protein
MGEDPSFDLTRPTLPENYLIAIGNVSYMWGLLESIMELAISKLSGPRDSDPRSAVMIAHMSWPQRMDVLETLVILLAPEYKYLSRFQEVKPKLKKAQNGRNRIIHAKWGYMTGKSIFLSFWRAANSKLQLIRFMFQI